MTLSKRKLKSMEGKTIDLYHEWVDLYLATSDPYAKDVMERMGKVIDKFTEAEDKRRLQNLYAHFHDKNP